MISATSIVYWKDRNGVYLGYHDFTVAQDVKALSAEHFLGKTDYDLYPAAIAALYHQQDQAVLAGQSLICETTLPESTISLTASKQPMRNAQGATIGIITHLSNLTLIAQQYIADGAAIQKIAQETVGTALKTGLSTVEYVHYLRDYLENIIAVIPGHVYWQDRNNVFRGCNNQQAQSAKLPSRKAIVGKTNHDMLWRDQADVLNQINNKVMETGEPYRAEEFAIKAEGPSTFLSQKVPLCDPQGNIIGLVGISFDITERKKAEEERLNLVLNAANMGTWTWDFNEDIFTHEYIYHEFPYHFYANAQQAINRAHPADRATLRQALTKAYAEGSSVDIEYRLTWPDGQTRHIALRGKVLEDRAGKPNAMVGVCWDISARKEAEKNIHQQQFNLAHIARINAMGELASTLAHELNQPLASIANYLNGCLIRLKNDNYSVSEISLALERAVAQATRAAKIIHRMKNFVRKGKLYYETVSINQVVQETVAISRMEPNAATVDILVELGSDLPAVELDKIQIGQVLLNLLRNAVEATRSSATSEHPCIIVKTHFEKNEICVDVIDNGPGISAESRNRLFMPYFTTKKTGMGIGLAICRTIIEAHKGCLITLNKDEPGAWFRFCLPVKK